MPPVDPPLTGAQYDYLAAFDSFLRGDPGAVDAKARALTGVLDEAGLDPTETIERNQRRHFRARQSRRPLRSAA